MSYYTRKQYFEDLAKLHEGFQGRLLSPELREKGSEFHRKYYGQLVSQSTKDAVRRAIGMERLLESSDPHLNDIPLKEWVDLSLPLATRMKNLGDYLTLGGKVCIAKEAANQLIEEARGQK